MKQNKQIIFHFIIIITFFILLLKWASMKCYEIMICSLWGFFVTENESSLFQLKLRLPPSEVVSKLLFIAFPALLRVEISLTFLKVASKFLPKVLKVIFTE